MQHALIKAQRLAAASLLSDLPESPEMLVRQGIGTWRYVAGEGILHISANSAVVLGLPPSSANRPVPLDEILEQFHPDDRMELSLRLQTAHLSSGGFQRDFRLADKDKTHAVRITAAPAPIGNGPSGIAGMLIDLSNWEVDPAGAATLEHAVAAADAGIWSLDLNTLDLSLSAKSRRMYGLPEDHPGILSHEDWVALVDPETATEAIGRLKDVTDLDQTHELEVRLRNPTSARWLRMIGRLSRDENGQPAMLSGLQMDVSHGKEMELALRDAEHRFQVAEEAAAIGCYATDANQRAYCSPGFYRIAGFPIDTPYLEFDAFAALVHPDDRQHFQDEVQKALVRGENYNAEFRIVRVDNGEVRWVHSRAKFIVDDAGKVVRSIGANVDITDRKRVEDALRKSEARSSSIVEAIADSVTFLDFDGRLLFMNQSGLRAVEIDDFEPLVGRAWATFWPAETRPIIERELDRARRGDIGHFTARNPTAKGKDKWWDVIVTATPAVDEARGNLLLIARDVTDHLQTLAAIRQAANHDALTGLSNRRAFLNLFTRALRRARKQGGQIALLLMDLDHFKETNDMFGHDAGDTILKSVAAGLCEAVGERGTIARLGGDEFAVILRDVESVADVEAVGAAILEKMRAPLVYRERMLSCAGSLGAALHPQHGSTVETLLKNADLAVYAAKSQGRSSLQVFDPRMRTAMRKHAAQIRLARSAVGRDAIMPFYQPKVRLDDGSIAGLEALLRLTDTKGRVRLPADMAAGFDDVELAWAIGEAMRRGIVGDMRRWLDAGLEFGHISKNVSAVELRRPEFVDRLLSALHDAGIPTSMLELEITETVFFDQGTGQIERSLGQLDRAGIRISLDDFGTGYASLSHLKRFPVSAIKIDQSFVRQIEETRDDAVIVRTLLGLGKSLGIEVVAEGIESAANVAFLRREGCEIGQGYYFGRPLPADEVPALLTPSAAKARLRA